MKFYSLSWFGCCVLLVAAARLPWPFAWPYGVGIMWLLLGLAGLAINRSCAKSIHEVVLSLLMGAFILANSLSEKYDIIPRVLRQRRDF